MIKKYYDNNIRQQCMSLGELSGPQVAGVLDGLQSSIPPAKLKEIHNIYLTGCGDSYMAACISVSAFKCYGKKFGHDFKAVRCIDFARGFKIEPKNAEAGLLVAISASGGAARIQEALLRAQKLGMSTLLVTNTPESPSAEIARYVLNLKTPAFRESGPGLRNFYASLVGVFLFAAYFGETKETAAGGAVRDLAEKITTYTEAASRHFLAYDQQAFDLIRTWKDYEAFDCIGDDIYFNIASFIRAKFVETSGVMIALTDTENWCHVHYFKGDPRQTPLIIVCSKGDHNESRVQETLRQAKKVGRPVAPITTADDNDTVFTTTENKISESGNTYLASSDTTFVIPAADKGFKFLETLYNFVPGALLASYYAAVNDTPYFGGGGVWSEGENNTIKTSKVVECLGEKKDL